MKATYEPASNMGYIYFVDEKEALSEKVIMVEEKGKLLFNLDLDKNGRLVGIELFDAKNQMPQKLMEEAEVYDQEYTFEPPKVYNCDK